MKKAIVLGLDIGTTNVKAAAFRVSGELVAEASKNYPTYYPQPGWAEQAPADWQAAVMLTLKQLVARLGDQVEDIAALGLSTHAPGFIPVDGRGVPLLERIPIWQDERSLKQGQRLLAEIGSHWVGLGMPFAAFAAKLKWFTENYPDLAKEARYALGVKAFLVHWLTGRYATDPSSEPGNSAAWERMCRACGWSLTKLAPVLAESAVAGEIRSELAEACGLKTPIPVVMGLNDGASATLGNGALKPGEGILTLGTNGVVFLVSDRPVAAELRLQQAFFCWPYVEGRWILGGQTKTGAASLQWLVGIFTNKKPTTADYDQILLECAGKPPGSHGVMFFPYLMGRGTPHDDPALTGAFMGLRMQTERADLVHAVLEGVAFTLREVTEALEHIQQKIEGLSITGGGAQSELWVQIVADVLNQPLQHGKGDLSLGAAILAAHGAGLFPTLQAALGAMRPETQHDPAPAGDSGNL